MRVVHVITKGDVGGAQTYVVELAIAQLRRGDDVTVYAGSAGPALQRVGRAGATTRVLPSLVHAINPLHDRRAARDLRAALEEATPDIVHGHSSKAGLLARMVGRSAPWATVYTAHGWPFQHGARLGQRIFSWAGEFLGGHLCGEVICLTNAELQRARRSRVAPVRSLHLVPNGLPDRRPPPTTDTSTAGPSIVMVARFAPPKRQDLLVGALPRLDELPWQLSFVGDGPQLGAVRALAAEQLPGRVEFLGHRDDVPELLEAADVSVLVSDYEGLPYSVLEAMRAGTCVVASDLAGSRELLEGDVGLLFTDVDGLTAALRTVITDPQRRKRYGAAGRQRFVERYTIDTMADRIDDVYAAAMSRRRSVRRS